LNEGQQLKSYYTNVEFAGRGLDLESLAMRRIVNAVIWVAVFHFPKLFTATACNQALLSVLNMYLKTGKRIRRITQT